MKKFNSRTLVLLALLLAALLSLFFASRHGRGPAAGPVPAAAPPALKEPRLLVNGPAIKKKRAAKKPGDKRYKRVSPLRDPGEALIGGSGGDAAPATAGHAVKNK